MKSGFLKFFSAVCITALFATKSFAAETNAAPATVNTNDIVNAYVQLQAQLHTTQLQIEQSRQEAAEAAQRNTDAMNARIAQLEQTLATQRAADTDLARRMQQLTFYLVGTVGLAGLAVFLLVGYFQWRALSQLAEIASSHSAALGTVAGVHQLAAPGRATVEVSNARLLDIVGQLEKKILDLESGGRLLAQLALEYFDKLLSTQPQNADVLAKKASALEKLGRVDEALEFCDRAIAANGSLVIAYLQKGGLLNRLARYDDALKCYEQALLAQEMKS